MARRCVFCGASGPMTREHVWPDWLSRTGFPNEPTVIESGPLNRLPSEFGPMRPLSTTVKAVCDKCNNGWMSRLEKELRHLYGR
ncbi:MAG: hypothetical protein C7B45_15330 [Sulfobacillus acidophilus]|uniref:HNH endonuclease 5 domain-containing protein n=1 Tax=Sulfobacillus acidophilus TaxID=53633 RepID=A0A2T2WDP7_9FIRM|nr:MAG: hypothetical protein C7B45_15330 [Sulfobacillus acidophilus]